MSKPPTPLVLGCPWLQIHNPHIDWANHKTAAWSSFCLSQCLESAPFPVQTSSVHKEVSPPDLSGVPKEYYDLKEVFSKELAISFLPHRLYDCGIGLLPGTPLPTSRLYRLPRAQRETLETYIRESPNAGIIHPSSTPVGAGFFFVSKKHKSLRLYIDFKGS